MQATAPGHDLLFSAILEDAGSLADGAVIVRHPFLCDPIAGGLARELLRRAERALSSPPTVMTAFAGPDAWARSWRATLGDRGVEGVTAAVRRAGLLEVRVILRPFPTTRRWRDAILDSCADLVAPTAWELPAGTDQSVVAPTATDDSDAHLPFALADNAVFHSPVLARPVHGAALVRRVIASAAAVYGSRVVGPSLAAGNQVLSLWSCEVSSVAIEAASLAVFDAERRATSLSVLFQPWPAVALFRARVRARAQHVLGPEYFD